MCLYFALMYKTLGDYKWTDLYKTILPDDECAVDALDPAVATDVIEQVVHKVQDQFAEFVIADEVEVAPESMMNSARMSLEGLKAVCLQFQLNLVHWNNSFLIYFLDIHNWSVSGSLWLRDVVELLRVVCCVFIRDGLPILLHQTLRRECFLSAIHPYTYQKHISSPPPFTLTNFWFELARFKCNI